MSALLVSVRNAEEAVAAFSAGADVIDVKEPSRGSLGMADVACRREVRAALPDQAIVSVALGEWNDVREMSEPSAFFGVSYRKVGLAGLGAHQSPFREFDRFRSRFIDTTPWIFVIYVDWERALAPHPDQVVAAVLKSSRTVCAGVLIDTWEKSRPSPIEGDLPVWSARIQRVRESGRFAALAGRLDERSIERLGRSARPDLFAVRGAACEAGDRLGAIEPARVAKLVAAARSCEPIGPPLFPKTAAPAYGRS